MPCEAQPAVDRGAGLRRRRIRPQPRRGHAEVRQFLCGQVQRAEDEIAREQARHVAQRNVHGRQHHPAVRRQHQPVAGGVIDLIEMKALVWKGENLGAEWDVLDIPADMQAQAIANIEAALKS